MTDPRAWKIFRPSSSGRSRILQPDRGGSPSTSQQERPPGRLLRGLPRKVLAHGGRVLATGRAAVASRWARGSALPPPRIPPVALTLRRRRNLLAITV